MAGGGEREENVDGRLGNQARVKNKIRPEREGKEGNREKVDLTSLNHNKTDRSVRPGR